MRQLKIREPNFNEENLEQNIFIAEIDMKIKALEKSKISYEEQYLLFKAIKNGDKSKIEPLAQSYEIIIYNCIKVFSNSNIAVDNCFLLIKDCLVKFIESQVYQEKSEKSFFKFVVFFIQQKVKEFEIE